MTVKELIAKLLESDLDLDAVVCISGRNLSVKDIYRSDSYVELEL